MYEYELSIEANEANENEVFPAITIYDEDCVELLKVAKRFIEAGYETHIRRTEK